MVFQVAFESKTSVWMAFRKESQSYGLEMAQAHPMPIAEQRGQIDAKSGDVCIAVPVNEMTAAERELFRHKYGVVVKVPKMALNKFVSAKPMLDTYTWKVDEDAVMAAWRAAGCPLEWELEA